MGNKRRQGILSCRVASIYCLLLANAASGNSLGTRFSSKPIVLGLPTKAPAARTDPAAFKLTAKDRKAIQTLCKEIDKKFARYQWKESACGEVQWHAEWKTFNQHPLIYATFGEGSDVTLLLGGVHPDELTPIPITFRFARYLHDNPGAFDPKAKKVIIAPLVNPDGFLRPTPTRTNAMGVDLNRNFFTLDWYDRAHDLWVTRRRSMERYFPGHIPNSEVETLFQVELIQRFRPQKILSIHAPLGFLDYDGPGDQKPISLSAFEQESKDWVLALSRKAQNYRIVDYSFYPGSLGNFGGNERNIPTVTLELETTNPTKLDEYWKQFLPGMVHSVNYSLPGTPKVASAQSDEDSRTHVE